MDDEVARVIRRLFDGIISDAGSTDQETQNTLLRLGIEPSLEIVLAYLSGFLIGGTFWFSIEKFNEVRAEDKEGIMMYLEKRAWLLREAILRARNQ